MSVSKQAYSPGIFIQEIWAQRENQSLESQVSGRHMDRVVKRAVISM
jgi:hypothetical protein